MSHGKMRVWPGLPFPLGATWDGKGVNFALFSENAEKVELCLFDRNGMRELERIEVPEYTNEVWHCYLPDVRPGQLYGYRVFGPYDPERGHRFNHHKLLLDPYAKSLAGSMRWNEALFGFRYGDPTADLSFDKRDSAPYMPKSLVVDTAFTWGDSRHPRTQWLDTIIYEAHVRGMTRNHPDVPKQMRGSFAGLASPAVVDYLSKLGVTAIELLPVQAFFDEWHLINRRLSNYWGYNPIGFFAPHPRFSATGGSEVKEFKTMVRVLHDAGIEVILDVVYNHTAEGNQMGPTLCFRGIDNAAYYRLEPGQNRYFQNFTGCGNTLNVHHSRVLQLVMDSLRYWVQEMGVDGFRFDLASTLARKGNGLFDYHSGFLKAVTQDPILSHVKLIAESWDLGGDGYQVGNFPPDWAEWNDHFRDDSRRIWKGDEGLVGGFASRLTGSSDRFHHSGRRPWASINFITAHDGFTLRDLVSYNHKHNLDNQEENRDGTDGNNSWNHGVEGPTDDPAIKELRLRQMRNLLATLFLSQGTPMMVAGDEIGRSQNGNNNAYCQDNEISWIDWENVDEEGRELLAFAQRLIHFRKQHILFRRNHFFTGAKIPGTQITDIVWLNSNGEEMTDQEWNLPRNKGLGMLLSGEAGEYHISRTGDAQPDDTFLVIFNHGDCEISWRLPDPGFDQAWGAVFDTAHKGGVCMGENCQVQRVYPMQPRSVTVLVRKPLSAFDGKTIDAAPAAESPLSSDDLEQWSQLAEEAGLESGYWTVFGEWKTVPLETMRAFLTALELPAGNREQVMASRRLLAEEPWRRVLEPVGVFHGQEAPPAFTLVTPADQAEETLEWALVEESGAVHPGGLRPADLPLEERREVDGRLLERRRFTLPMTPPLGYHRFELTSPDQEPGQSARMAVIMAPRACFLPEKLAGEADRTWGFSPQLFALRSKRNWGVGDFTDLKNLAAKAVKKGAGVIGLNPLHALFPRHPERYSPYSPSSRYFLNPIYIDPEAVPELAHAAKAKKQIASRAFRQELTRLRSAEMVDYAGVAQVKYPIFRELHAVFRKENFTKEGTPDTDRSRAFAQYREKAGPQLRRLALYDALCEHFGETGDGDASWRQWPLPFRDPDSPEVEHFARDNEALVEFYEYIYWVAEEQLAAVAAICQTGGMPVGLYADIALGMETSGADFWSQQQQFVSGAGIGAPPDEFNPKGQDWGLPPYNPRKARLEAYDSFASTLRANMAKAGAVRLDHVMGLMRLFWVPSQGGADEGGYVRYPFEDLLGIVTLESQRNQCLVIGEALGTVPEGLRERLAEAGILSYKLLYFERGEGGSFLPPEAYPAMSLVAATTHDLPTFTGFWQGLDIEVKRELGLFPSEDLANRVAQDREGERHNLIQALSRQGVTVPGEQTDAAPPLSPELIRAVYKYLAQAPGKLLMVQLEDILQQDHQVNMPGTTVEHPNWMRKLPVDLEDLFADPRFEAMTAMLRKIRPPA